MEVYCNGTARIRHHGTGQIHEIESDELDWEVVGSDDRQMGPEFHYEASVEHADLGKLTWGLWEYPVGAENDRETDAGPHEVLEDFDFGLEHSEPEPEPEEWLDPAPADDPFSIFMSSFSDTTDLLEKHGSGDGRHLVNRMVFSHQVTALEAYLGDTLINEVFSDASALQRLLDQDDDLAKEKFTLAEIAKESGLIERKAREHLRSILYHNLAKVDALYAIALEIRILNLAKDKPRLFKAVKLRHDCVHRNGFDKEGNQLVEFTNAYVQETADSFKDFVESIERAVRARSDNSA